MVSQRERKCSELQKAVALGGVSFNGREKKKAPLQRYEAREGRWAECTWTVPRMRLQHKLHDATEQGCIGLPARAQLTCCVWTASPSQRRALIAWILEFGRAEISIGVACQGAEMNETHWIPDHDRLICAGLDAAVMHVHAELHIPSHCIHGVAILVLNR